MCPIPGPVPGIGVGSTDTSHTTDFQTLVAEVSDSSVAKHATANVCIVCTGCTGSGKASRRETMVK